MKAWGLKQKFWVSICCTVIASVFLFVTAQTFAALPSSAWESSEKKPTVLDGDILTQEEYDKLFRGLVGIHGRQTCKKKEVPIGGIYDDAEDCWYGTEIGELGSYGYLFRPKGSRYAGYVNGVQSRLVPTHNPNMFIEFVPVEEGGFEAHFRNTAATEMKAMLTEWDYPIFYEWKNPPTKIIKDRHGDPWIIDEDTINNQIWYSENGRWMVIWHKDGYAIRIDLGTLKFLTLQAKLPNDGDEQFASVDIAPDGGQIAVNIFGRPLRLINTETCGQHETDRIAEPEFCNLTFLNTYVAKASNTYMGYGVLPIFKDDTTLEFYMPVDGEYWSYLIFAPGTYHEGTDYIALGDSYASGEGAFSYFKGTDIKGVNKCHLSKVSYPYRIGKWLELDSTHSVSCSGARIKNVIGPEFIDEKLEDERRTNQYIIDRTNTTLGNWTPGYELQKKFILENKPDITTISIGGNDIGFGTKVARCVRWPDTCYNSYEDREEIVIEINSEYGRLIDTYRQIKREGKPGAKIYVIGYPQVAKEDGSCGFNVRLNSKEIRFSNQLIQYLNSVIQRAAQKAGVTYVNIENALYGYRLCEHKKPAVHGVTAGRDNYGVLGNESYHPTEWGNWLIGEAILRETDDFTKKSPRPDLSLSSPEIDDAAAFLDGEERTYRRTLAIKYNQDISEDFFMRGVAVHGDIYGAHYDLRPNSPYEFVFTSDPVSVGTFTTDAHGNLQYNFTIPPNMEPGFHTLHIYGQDNAGKQIDIYKDVFIAASEEDWDGDGILNKDSPCKIALPNPDTGAMELNWCMAQGAESTDYPSETFDKKQKSVMNKGSNPGAHYGRSEKLRRNSFRMSVHENGNEGNTQSSPRETISIQAKYPARANKHRSYSKFILPMILIGLLGISMLFYRKRKQKHA